MKHYNPSITERANRIFNLKNGDGMSEEIDGPVAVIPLSHAVKVVKRVAATGTLLATGDKDFYVTSLYISFSKAATDAGSVTVINAVIDGVTVNLLETRGVTLTADSQTVVSNLTVPVKVDRNTNITFTATGAFGSVAAQIMGYFEEVTRT